MASKTDVHDLLRLLTTGRNKLPMLAAMARAKALQGAGLRSIEEIASADLSLIGTAIDDVKAAKTLQNACKALVKDPSKKRTAEPTLSHTAKRSKSAYELDSEPQTSQALEQSLRLPQPSADEEAISQTTIYTNRAPLVLAFAVQLLKYTMPEQPLSSRLSLAQAVVSVNSRSKAVSLGLEKGPGADGEGWGMGQPKIRVLGREIHVLKRGDYDWRPEDDHAGAQGNDTPDIKPEGSGAATVTEEGPASGLMSGVLSKDKAEGEWTVSASVTSKKSTFVARSIAVSSSSQARAVLQNLLSSNRDIREADHNITAWRIQGAGGGIVEESNDDGETGGGRHILQTMQSSDVVGVLLVVTRWYGGIMLGPDRWRTMSQVSRDALSQRLRIAGIIGREALWGLDLETMRSTNAPVTGGAAGGMPIYKPESARSYIMKAFGPAPPTSASPTKKKSGAALEREKEENLGLLLGALDMLFASWSDHISRDDLDRRAWAWYVQVRPEVESGVAGWGGKGEVPLSSILKLRRTI